MMFAFGWAPTSTSTSFILWARHHGQTVCTVFHLCMECCPYKKDHLWLPCHMFSINLHGFTSLIPMQSSFGLRAFGWQNESINSFFNHPTLVLAQNWSSSMTLHEILKKKANFFSSMCLCQSFPFLCSNGSSVVAIKSLIIKNIKIVSILFCKPITPANHQSKIFFMKSCACK